MDEMITVIIRTMYEDEQYMTICAKYEDAMTIVKCLESGNLQVLGKNAVMLISVCNTVLYDFYSFDRLDRTVPLWS